MEEALIVAIIQIIAIDIILGGDNAIIIALACRNLPQRQKRLGILWGTAGAIILRCILVFFASTLLTIPSLKLIGGLLLLWIGIKLLADEDDFDEGGQIISSFKECGEERKSTRKVRVNFGANQ